MLTVLLITAVIGQGQSWDSIGKNFITAFPENIAFYYPVDPVNAVKVTALFDNTTVTVKFADNWTYQEILTPGKPLTVALPLGIEEYRFVQSLRTIRVVGSRPIVVQSINQKGDSVQTNVIQPQKNLGTFYSIPSLNYTQMINSSYQLPNNISKRYSSFRLVIINAEDMINYVTIVKRHVYEQYELNPFSLLQLQMDGTEIAVRALNLIDVMLTHPCVETAECRCNMVVNHLRPNTFWGSQFILPFIVNISNIWLHVTSSTNITAGSLPPLEPRSQFINTSDPVSLRLVAPGFIIEPIPQSMFSACYLALVSSTDAQALVIAETDDRDSVYIDGDLLASTKWSPIADSVYSSVLVSLDDNHVIWHPSRNISVYVFERSTHIYGGEAIAISAKPDPLGCALIPSTFYIVNKTQTWPESHQNCLVISDELFSPSNKAAQMEMADILNDEGPNELLWIGLRRSLLTLDWYRQKGNSEHKLTYTQWGSGEPSLAVKGMCASVFASSSMDFLWKNVPCCTQLKSVCYTRAEYFPLYFPISEDNADKQASNDNNNENNLDKQKNWPAKKL